MNKIIGVIVLSLLNTATLAASVPHTFTSGTPANAAEVNANFAALAAAITALETKVSPATAADLAGTYSYFELRIDVDNLSGTSKAIAGAGVSGTVVLNANGTGSANLSESYRQLTFNDVNTGDQTVSVGFNNLPGTTNASINWSVSNGVVTIDAASGTFIVVGQLLIQSIVNFEGQNGIAILARR